MRRVLALILAGLALVGCVALAATESLTNRTGRTAMAVTVTFSEEVRITSYDESVFPTKDPSSRSDTFTFGGGQLDNGARFAVSWTPSTAEITGTEWEMSSAAASQRDIVPSFSNEEIMAGFPTTMFCGLHAGGNWGLNTITTLRPPAEWFQYIAGMNANWIGFNISLGLDDSTDSTVEVAHGSTPGMIVNFEDGVLRNLIRQLRSWGFHVYASLAFENISASDPSRFPEGKYLNRFALGDPRVPEWTLPQYWPWSPTHPDHARFVEEFFQTYTDVAVYYGQLLQEEGAELYSLGGETDYLFRTRAEPPSLPTSYRAELSKMVEAVRAVYHGALTYDMNSYAIAGNEDTKESDKIWGDLGLDVIGVSTHFPIESNDLGTGWERLFSDYFAPLRKAYPNKPIVCTEFGYADVPDARHVGWFGEADNPLEALVDKDGDHLDDGQEEQAAIFEAFFDTTARHPGLVQGIFSWEMEVGSDADWASPYGGLDYRGESIRGRLAEDVVRDWFGTWLAGEVSRPTAPDQSNLAHEVVIGDIGWDSIPICISYAYGPTVSFFCDGDTNLAHAQFWGRDGLHVEGFRVGVSDAGLAVSIELYGADKMGRYGYTVAFRVGNSSLYMMLYPQGPLARLAADVNGQWVELGTASLKSTGLTGTTMRAWFPSDTPRVPRRLDYVDATVARAAVCC